MKKARRNSKDSVFCDLFRRPEYLLQLYQCLHPEDVSATEDMLQIATLSHVLMDQSYNDLGFVVRDKLLVLVEAQSTWSVNIIIRSFMYLAETYQDRFVKNGDNLYSTTKVQLPEPELYVLYTGDRKRHPKTLSLSKEFFGGKKTGLDVTVNMLYGDGTRRDILDQYVRFCHILNKQVKLHDYTEEAIRETIRICMDEKVLADYLKQHESEVTKIMITLFDNDYLCAVRENEIKKESEKRGEKRGKKCGMELITKLTKLLISQKRYDEASRMADDPALCNKLLHEFNLA